MITSEQCRAARSLLGLSQSELVERTGISIVSISAFEKGGTMRLSNQEKVRAALEAAGVEFIENGAASRRGGGVGVRLSKGGNVNGQ